MGTFTSGGKMARVFRCDPIKKKLKKKKIRDAIADNEIAFTVNIPYEQLRSWYEFKEERP